MCTSWASKPARVEAAAVSIWLLTPCSRRIATAGRAPPAIQGAATSSLGSKLSAACSPGSGTSSSREYSSPAHSGSSRSAACDTTTSLQRGAGPAARPRTELLAVAAQADLGPARDGADVAAQAPQSVTGRRWRRPPRLASREPARPTPSSSAKHVGNRDRGPCRDRSRDRSAPQRPSRAASPAGRRPSGRDRRAAAPRASARAAPRSSDASSCGSSRSGGSPPSFSNTCASTSRRGDSCRRRDR